MTVSPIFWTLYIKLSSAVITFLFSVETKSRVQVTLVTATSIN